MDTPKLVRKLETYVLVTVVTALVWLYAEGENLAPGTATLQVRFVAPPGAELRIEPDGVAAVAIEFQTPTKTMRDFQRMIQQPVQVELRPNPENNTQIIDLRERLNLHPVIREMNVSVSKATPATQQVTVEPMKQFQAQVELVPGGLELASDPNMSPEQVAITMPQSYRDLFSGPLKVHAKLSEVPDLATADKGVPLTREVPLSLPERIGALPEVAIHPTRVRVTFTIVKQTATKSLTGVPILVRLPVIESNNYVILPENQQRLLAEDVMLQGPRDVMERVGTSELPVYAVLFLSTDDLEKGITSKQLHLDVPPDVVVTSPLPRLNFTIKRREDSANGVP